LYAAMNALSAMLAVLGDEPGRRMAGTNATVGVVGAGGASGGGGGGGGGSGGGKSTGSALGVGMGLLLAGLVTAVL